MRKFTNEELNEIRLYLIRHSKSDSDIEKTYNISDDCTVTVLQNNENKRVSMQVMRSYLNGDLDMAEIEDIENLFIEK